MTETSTANDNVSGKVIEEPDAQLYWIHTDYLADLKDGEPLVITDHETGNIERCEFSLFNSDLIGDEGWYYWFQYEGFPAETKMVGPFDSPEEAHTAGEYAWDHDELDIIPLTTH